MSKKRKGERGGEPSKKKHKTTKEEDEDVVTAGPPGEVEDRDSEKKKKKRKKKNKRKTQDDMGKMKEELIEELKERDEEMKMELKKRDEEMKMELKKRDEEMKMEMKKGDKEMKKRDEEMKKRVETLRRRLDDTSCHSIDQLSSKISDLPTKSVPKLLDLCAAHEILKKDYIAMCAIRDYKISHGRTFDKEEQYLEIKAKLEDPEYLKAHAASLKYLAYPSTIAGNAELWRQFANEEILQIPARLFGTLFRDETVQPRSYLDLDHALIRQHADYIKYGATSFMEEIPMNEDVISLLQLTGFHFQKQCQLDNGKGKIDGVYFGPQIEPVVIVESKLPHSAGHPIMQGFIHRIRANAEHFHQLNKSGITPPQSCCPCLIITNTGMEFDVYGVLTLQTEQRKAKNQDPGFAYSFIRKFSLFESGSAIRFISWLKKKMTDLMAWQLSPLTAQSQSLLSRFPDCVPEVNFKQHLRDNLFESRMKDSNKKCIVKFLSSGYGKEVHEFCAEWKYAPEILLFSSSADGDPPIVIVMEKEKKFKTLYDRLKKKKVKAPRKVCENLRKAVEAMQRNRYVHGDIRPPNVLTNYRGDVRLIDFDWAGIESPKVTYPAELNGNIEWPPGASFRKPIKMEHDTFMMKEIIKQIKDISRVE